MEQREDKMEEIREKYVATVLVSVSTSVSLGV